MENQDARPLDTWAREYWSGPPIVTQLGGEHLDLVLARQVALDHHRHGSRARLARSIRGVRHLQFPDRARLEDPRLVFSGDGRATYPRDLQSVRWSDFVGSHPVRDYSRRSGQKNKPIAFYSRTMSDLVNCESRLERGFALLADFNPDIVHIAAQPFAIQFPTGDEMSVHTVDFVVLALGRIPLAVDVKTPEAAADAKWIARHERVRRILAQAGIGHVVWTGLERTVIENLAYFAASRVPTAMYDHVRDRAISWSYGGITAGQLAVQLAPYVGDTPGANGRTPQPVSIALVLVRALLWEQALSTDLSLPFTANSRVVSR